MCIRDRFTVTYDGAAEDQVSLDALERVREALDGYLSLIHISFWGL